jgi:diguanylate cyclase (GGDEF)-like protein
MRDIEREALRQRALEELALLDTPPQPEFDSLVKLACRLLGTGMASITLVDTERQWFKARSGPLAPQTTREHAFCPVVVETEAPLIVADATLDPRFATSPFVTGTPYIRYYAGVPVRIRRPHGSAVTVGTLCVLDAEPREPCPTDLEPLQELACAVQALFEAQMVALRAAETAENWGRTVEHLERERRQFKQAERMAHMGSWRYDIEKRRPTWSDGVLAIHELPIGGNMPSGELMDFLPEPDRAHFLEAVMRTLDTGEPFELDADFVTAKGNRRRVRCLGEIELSKGKPVALIGLIQDVTDRYCMEQQLLHHARTDDLTQLPNRAEFHRVLDEAIQKAETADSELAVLLIDLDGFKSVNDALGHAMGDEVLRRVAERLQAPYLEACFPARLGGDEFALMVPPAVGRAVLNSLVERLLRNLHIVVECPGQIASVTGTIGIAWSSTAGHDRDALLRQADAALYAAKRSRKGTALTYQVNADHRLAG